MRLSALIAIVMIATGAPARADEERDAQYRKQELAALAQRLPKIAPDPGRETAPVRPPPWCDGLKVEGSYSPGGIGRTIEAGQRYSNSWDEFINAAYQTCLFPKEPEIQQAVAVIEQLWINTTGLSEKQALETIKLRLDKDKLKADKAKLCGELAVSDEAGGEDKAFLRGRRALFGCDNSPPLWSEQAGVGMPDDEVADFLDVSTAPDDLARLALVLDRSRVIAFNSNSNAGNDRDLVAYVTDQVDYQALSPPAVMKLLDAAPFAGNSYARTVVLESLGRAHAGIDAVDAAVKKKSKDADWKELLVTAPQAGIAEWKKAAAKNRDAVTRSNEFEHKFWGPSRRAVKGCVPALRKDFVALARTLKHGNASEFKEALSDPIAALLFTRVAACYAVDGDGHYAGQLLALSKDLRYSRGPRIAAYWGALDALDKIRADRTKFPIKPDDLGYFRNRPLYDEAYRQRGDSGMGFVGDGGKSVVKSVKKTAAGLQVSFVTQKHQEVSLSCVDTNHILAIRADGTLVYRQNCHPNGMITIDNTVPDITVPTEWADGITAGAAVEFMSMLGKPPTRVGLPTAVYSDKSKRKLVNFYGFGL